MSEADRLRARLQGRKAEKAAKHLLRFPFIIDDELATRVTTLADQHERLAALIAHLEERIEQADEAGERDVRASGHDTSGLSDKLDAARDALAKVRADLEQSTEQADADRFFMEFLPCGSGKYEEILALHPNADDGPKQQAEFRNALLDACFVRFERDGETLDLGYKSWSEFAAEAALDFGEIDPIRAAVLIACNRNPHHLLSGRRP